MKYELLQSDMDSGIDTKGRAFCDNSYRLKGVNHRHKKLHLTFCSGPRSTSGDAFLIYYFNVAIVCDAISFLNIILLLIFRYKL